MAIKSCYVPRIPDQVSIDRVIADCILTILGTICICIHHILSLFISINFFVQVKVTDRFEKNKAANVNQRVCLR